MKEDRVRWALLVLQWVLGLVILAEAAGFAFSPAAAHAFAKTGLPDFRPADFGLGGDGSGHSVSHPTRHDCRWMVPDRGAGPRHRHPPAARLVRRGSAPGLCGCDVGGDGGEGRAYRETNMTGDELIEQFERSTTPADSFHHADHVRLAFEYLSRYPITRSTGAILRCVEEVCGGAGESAALSRDHHVGVPVPDS